MRRKQEEQPRYEIEKIEFGIKKQDLLDALQGGGEFGATVTGNVKPGFRMVSPQLGGLKLEVTQITEDGRATLKIIKPEENRS